MNEVLGILLGKYRITEQLGEGGMGVVYIGRHEALAHRVVLKVLRPEMSRNADMVRRFFNEAQAATAINHPGIVQVFDFGMIPSGQAYFVMELLEGETLGARIRRRRLDSLECCRIGRQVANVLQAAHAAGITHRDLKPDNLFLVPDAEVAGGERVKVLDFGIAKLAGELFTAGVKTGANLVMGTPSYMSPEQCRGAGGVDTRTDIYALGCILFKMACGRAPFLGHGAGDIIGAHLYTPPPPLQRHAPDVAPELAALIAKMLEKQPGARPQTMAAVSQTLGEILHALEGPPGRPSTPPPVLAQTMPGYGQAPLPGLPPAMPWHDQAPSPASSLATTLPVSSLVTTLPEPGPSAPPREAAMAPPAPPPAQLSSTSTTLGGAAGTTTMHPRAGTRLSVMLGGGVVAGTLAAVVLALATGGSSSAKRQVAYDDIASAARASDAAAAGTEDAAVVPAATDGAAAAGAPEATSAEDVEAVCRGFEVDRSWAELEQCADKLKALAPERAEKLKARAVKEAEVRPRIAAFEAALREGSLRRARTELEAIWPESVELPRLKARYAAAEAEAIDKLAGQLERVKAPDCAEYKALVEKARGAQTSNVAATAAGRVPCTPAPAACDAGALAEQGQQLEAAGKPSAALEVYEAARSCDPEYRLAEKGLVLACKMPSLKKAKLFWKRLPAAAKRRVLAGCEKNQITEPQLDAP